MKHEKKKTHRDHAIIGMDIDTMVNEKIIWTRMDSGAVEMPAQTQATEQTENSGQ